MKMHSKTTPSSWCDFTWSRKDTAEAFAALFDAQPWKLPRNITIAKFYVGE